MATLSKQDLSAPHPGLMVWATSAGKGHDQVRYWAGAGGACNRHDISNVSNSICGLATRNRRNFLLWHHMYIHNIYLFSISFPPSPPSTTIRVCCLNLLLRIQNGKGTATELRRNGSYSGGPRLGAICSNW